METVTNPTKTLFPITVYGTVVKGSDAWFLLKLYISGEGEEQNGFILSGQNLLCVYKRHTFNWKDYEGIKVVVKGTLSLSVEEPFFDDSPEAEIGKRSINTKLWVKSVNRLREIPPKPPIIPANYTEPSIPPEPPIKPSILYLRKDRKPPTG